MKNILIFVFWIISLGAFSQITQLIPQYGNVYRPYIFPEVKDSPIPNGYQPFYISHIGRHGSRYPVDFSYVNKGAEILQIGDSLGILTEKGKGLLRCFQHLDAMCQGMYGMLCDRGIEELGKLGTRMGNRFPLVFENDQRRQVNVCATEKPRAILSGANFTAALASAKPGLKYTYTAGPKYTVLLCNDATPEIMKNNHKGGSLCDKYMEQVFPYKTFYERFFTDVPLLFSKVKSKRLLAESTFVNGTVASYLGYDDLVEYMLPEEYKTMSNAYTNKMFFSHCNAKAYNIGAWRMHYLDDLLRDFITKADAAIADTCHVAADLRFSHDTGMMPFFTLIGLNHYDKAVTFAHGYEVWNSTQMCMATNLQLIFYKNAKNDILVKFLLNEEETSIPAVKPAEGPFYHWSDIKQYWATQLAKKQDYYLPSAQ